VVVAGAAASGDNDDGEAYWAAIFLLFPKIIVVRLFWRTANF
jgi:hypothetical protein